MVDCWAAKRKLPGLSGSSAVNRSLSMKNCTDASQKLQTPSNKITPLRRAEAWGKEREREREREREGEGGTRHTKHFALGAPLTHRESVQKIALPTPPSPVPQNQSSKACVSSEENVGGFQPQKRESSPSSTGVKDEPKSSLRVGLVGTTNANVSVASKVTVNADT